jgi:Asp-tRNA(Asn)/Glu-tRNA(Gln) amidotransferase A subunit family amidase
MMSAPTIELARDRFRRGEQTPSELTEVLLSAIEAHDGRLRAYAAVDAASARAAARAADEAYERERETSDDPPELAGVALSIKDNIDVAGMVSGCGHPPRSDSPPAEDDAPAVARLRQAGAVMLGKAQMHQYALGITGRNDALGTPRNPHDETRLPGGSSSGSAVSVAGGLALGSIGSDTGGSVRVPAALCGLVGFKPSFGRVPRGGLFPLSDSMDHVGVLTHKVAGARRLFRVLAATSDEAPKAIAPHQPRLAVIGELFALAAPTVTEPLVETCARLVSAGASIEERRLPGLLPALDTYGAIVTYEGARVHREEFATSPEHFGADLRDLFEARPSDDDDYRAALEARVGFAEEVSALLAEGYDGLLAPTTLVPAPALDAEHVSAATGPDGPLSLGVREALLICTCPFSMIGVPAISLPAGQHGQLPIGLQLIARRDADEHLLALSSWIEATLGNSTTGNSTTD